MLTVWEFELSGERTDIEIPWDHKILKVAAQDERICLWTLVNTKAEKVQETFHVYGTGHQIDKREGPQVTEDLEYIGTAHLQKGVFVFHVFKHHIYPNKELPQ